MPKVYIYALCEPDEWQEIRYIGATHDVRKRVKSHLNEAGWITQDHVSVEPYWEPRIQWLFDLRSQQREPVVLILEETDEDGCAAAEHKWIHACLAEGDRLTNRHLGMHRARRLKRLAVK